MRFIPFYFIPEFALQPALLIAIDTCLDVHNATAVVRLLYIETDSLHA